MGFAEIVAFIRALPEMVKVLGELRDDVKQLRQDSIDKEIDKLKSEVADTLKKIEGAKTNEDRKRLSMELAVRMSK